MRGQLRDDTGEQLYFLVGPLPLELLLLMDQAESLVFDEDQRLALEDGLDVCEVLVVLSGSSGTSSSRARA